MGIPSLRSCWRPGCSPWRPQSEPTTSCDAVTDGGAARPTCGARVTAVVIWNSPLGTVCSRRAERHFLSLAIFWRMRGEVQQPRTVAPGHDENDSGLRGLGGRPADLETVGTATSMTTTHTGRPVTGDRRPMSGLARKRAAATITASRRTCALMVAPILLPKSGTTMRLGSR
jgi:hypothetical protein